MNSPTKAPVNFGTPTSEKQSSPSLRNSKAQLLRLDALYAAEDKQNMNEWRTFSCFDETSNTNYDDDDEDYFMKEALASLRDLDEWQRYLAMTADVDCDSSSNASCNSSHHAKGGPSSALNDSLDSSCISWCGLGCAVGRSTGEATSVRQQHTPPSTSAVSSLKEIQDDDIFQRKRIAEAIAAKKAMSKDKRSGVGARSPIQISKSIALKKYRKLFYNNDRAGNLTSKENQHRKRTSAGSFQDDTTSSTVTSSSTSTIFSKKGQPTENESQQHSFLEIDDNKELQLRRAFFGTARVLTMDGIVESFASTTSVDVDCTVSKFDALHGVQCNSAPKTPGGPLTWV